MDEQNTTYAVTMTVSGISIPVTRKLRLGQAVVVANSKASGLGHSQVLLSNAIPINQTGEQFRAIAQFVLITSGTSSGEVPLERARDSCELSALPLRLVTPSDVLLDRLKLAPGTIDLAIENGSDGKAFNPYGEVLVTLLDETACNLIEGGLAQLVYDSRFDAAIWRFTNAHYETNSAEGALKFLLSLETLLDPNGRERDRTSRVANRAALLGGISKETSRDIRKLVREAYKHRRALWHGETDEPRLEDANGWLAKHRRDLKMLASCCIQRALRFVRENNTDNLMTLLARLEGGTADLLKMTQRLPILFFNRVQRAYHLDPATFTASPGGTIELIPSPDL